LPVGAHPAVDSVVKNIMRDGKKARYERMVAEALRLLQLKTNQNPVELLTRALDMCAPLVKLMSTKRGARRIQVPRPLTERARRRFAVLWIKQAAEKKKGSFPVRFANEILLVLRGTSGALERRAFVHRTALQNRTN
ncbi:ribosomal protein S7 domain-containing protein, partial [Hyaloraphidium curvatum]